MESVSEAIGVPEDSSHTLPEILESESQLHQVVRTGKRKAVNEFLQSLGKGPQVDPKNSRDETPLHLACLLGHVAIVQFLVKYEADCNARDKDGNTPIICLAMANKDKAATIAGTLINRGCSAGHYNNMNQTALHWAAKNGNPDFVRTLKQIGLSPYDKDSEGQTPIDYCPDDKDGEKCRAIMEGTMQ